MKFAISFPNFFGHETCWHVVHLNLERHKLKEMILGRNAILWKYIKDQERILEKPQIFLEDSM